MALYNPALTKKLEDDLKKDPRSKSFCVLAQIYYSGGELDKAEQLCLKGLKSHPQYSPAYVLLAEIYKSQKQDDKALKCLNQAKELNPDNSNIYKNLAEIYSRQNNLEQTLNAYKMLAFFKPTDKTALSVIPLLEKMMGKAYTKKFSEKNSQHLAKLQQILSRIELYMANQQTKGG